MWYDWAADNPYYVDPLNTIGLLRMTAAPGADGLLASPRTASGASRPSPRTASKTGRLAVNLGLRLDYSLEFVPAQTRPALSLQLRARADRPRTWPTTTCWPR